MATAIDEDRLSETFAALANTTRRAILARLAQGAATVNELAEPFDLTLPAISKHIKVLERAGPDRSRAPGAVPAVRTRCRSTPRGVGLGRAVPTGLGGPLRADGRLPRSSCNRNERQASTMTDSNGAHDSLVIERTLDAPVELVWQMWTDPEHFKAWYGPDGASIPVAELDVRVGGTRRVCMEMRPPNGPMRMWFTGEHLEVDRPARLVYTESMTDEHGNPMSPDGHPATTEVHIELEAVAGTT